MSDDQASDGDGVSRKWKSSVRAELNTIAIVICDYWWSLLRKVLFSQFDRISCGSAGPFASR